MAELQLHIDNCTAERVGSEHGVDAADLDAAADRMATIVNQLNATRGSGWERWRDLPFDPMRSEHISAVEALAGEHQPRTEHLIVLGIGGSALGNIALQSALNPHTHNMLPREQRSGPRLYVLDNVDPSLVGRTLALIQHDDPGFERTLVNVISKSGETAETAAQFMLLRSMLKNALGDAHASHIVAITDQSKGTMRAICKQEGYATLPVPEGVGGRFSVLSPVGLFSAAMCGIDIRALLDGAAAMDTRCSNPDLHANPAALLAWLLMDFTKRGKPNHVMMPYCNALYSMADWFRQLWAESLGKRTSLDGEEIFAGATPIKALGATDQHSQVQLYREGPNDKVFGFLQVNEPSEDITIPDDLDIEQLAYLHNATLGQLLMAEKRATEFALLESHRPNFTIEFPKLDAHAIGEFIQLWAITTACAGALLNIDPYDQPAVETGKVATFGLMGRPGYEEWKRKVEGRH